MMKFWFKGHDELKPAKVIDVSRKIMQGSSRSPIIFIFFFIKMINFFNN